MEARIASRIAIPKSVDDIPKLLLDVLEDPEIQPIIKGILSRVVGKAPLKPEEITTLQNFVDQGLFPTIRTTVELGQTASALCCRKN